MPDTSRPDPARIYAALLGAADTFAADRDEAARLTVICPDLPALAAENRAFLDRVVTWAAGEGIGQFLDLGAGFLADCPSVYGLARKVVPRARVVYVDSDPFVAYMAAMRMRDSGAADVAFTEADLTRPAAALRNPALTAVIDPADPVCVIATLVLGSMSLGRARRAVAGYARRLAPGSVVAITTVHVSDPDLAGRLAAAYGGEWANHGPGDIAKMLRGLDLIPPGVTGAYGWRAGWNAHQLQPRDAHVLAAVARKPLPGRRPRR